MKDLIFDRTEQKTPFQTFDEIQRTIGRGKIGKAEKAALWESLHLTLEEVHEVLKYVRETTRHPFIYSMFAFAAITRFVAAKSAGPVSKIGTWKDAQSTFER